MNADFTRYEPADIRDLIADYPLAWVSAAGGEAEQASLLPLLGGYDEAGRLVRLVGHMARRNPLVARLAVDPRVLILVTGPHAYISPEHAGRREWGPTWNYAQLRIEADLVFTPQQTGTAIGNLVDHMEADRDAPWSGTELGARYAGMEAMVIGFEAKVTKVSGLFKLGQDEHPDVLAHILDTLPDPGLCRWMRRFNGLDAESPLSA
jgi:transcriptional regulator